MINSMKECFEPQMINSMKECVMYSDLWPWPMSWRSFSHDFVIKLLKYGICCGVCCTACTVLDGFFPYLAQIIIRIRCVACNDLWPRPISSRWYSHDFAIKLLKYGISCHVRSTACTVLVGFFPYLKARLHSRGSCKKRGTTGPYRTVLKRLWSGKKSEPFRHEFVTRLW